MTQYLSVVPRERESLLKMREYFDDLLLIKIHQKQYEEEKNLKKKPTSKQMFVLMYIHRHSYTNANYVLIKL